MNGHRKRTGLTASGIAAALSCVLFFSCNNEDLLTSQNPEKACENICFGVSPDENVRTRGGDNGKENEYTSDRFVLRSQDSADTLCVRAIVSEGISISDANTQKVITRGAPLTKDNFDKFHVLAYWKKNDSPVGQFYMNEDAIKKGDIWSTDRTYYWPGAAHKLQFYAWAPVDAEFTSTPTSPTETTLAYTVPANAADQKDIVVATTDKIDGNKNESVPLTFKHICTAVRFAVSDNVPAGTITNVALKNVKAAGTYNMATNGWTLTDAQTTYSQKVNFHTNGDGHDSQLGSGIVTPSSGTFMMLPQTLPTDAEIEIHFLDHGHDRILTASIAGTEWIQGKTMTYRISITPEYTLEFLPDNITEVDAHYDIIPIKMKAKDLQNRKWHVRTNQPWVTTRCKLTPFEAQGYWLKADGDYGKYCASQEGGALPTERTQDLIEEEEGDEVIAYLFFEENVGTADRTVEIELAVEGELATESMTITQKCPNWKGDIGWEVIEDGQTLPYGFKWDRKVTYQYDMSGLGSLTKAYNEWFIKQVFKKQPDGIWDWLVSLFVPKTVDYVNVQRNNDFLTVSIDYSQIDSGVSAGSSTDGQENTWNLYSHVGGTSFEGEQTLLDRGYTLVSEIGSLENTKNFAGLYAVKLNPVSVTEGRSGTNVTYAIIYENQEELKWYLPASGQFVDDVGLNGEYWSSTCVNDNQKAYTWNSSATQTPRMELHKVRAVRINP